MKKAQPTPGQIFQKRIYKNKIMKLHLDERIDDDNKENKSPYFPPLAKNVSNKHDREVKDHGPHNPFDLPQNKRVFSIRKPVRRIKQEPFIISEPHTICDIDNTFYKIIEGRPLRQLDDIKVYIRNIRDITLFKANAAYLKDQIIQIDMFHKFEQSEFRKIEFLYIKCKNNFVQFARQNYLKAKEVQNLAEIKAEDLRIMAEKLEAYSFNYVKIRNQLSVICVNLETLSRYRQFLNKLSPLPWRAEQNQEFVEKDPFFSNIDTDTSIEPRKSLEMYKRTAGMFAEVHPKLYFRKPAQLMDVFETVRRQCLNYMGIEVLSSSILTSVSKCRYILKVQVVAEMNELQDFLQKYEDLVKFAEHKEVEYKIIFDRILMNEFQELYSSYDASKLFTCVQYVNTRIFGDHEDPRDNITTVMLELERHYMDLTSGLDSLDVEVVKKATTELFAEDIKIMKRAYKAQRELRECDILRKALYTSFEPSRHKNKNKTN